MGFNSESSLPVVFDLETFPIDGASRFVSAPSNYKDPDKIAQYIEEKSAMLAVDVDLCRIVALGYMSPNDDDATVWVIPDETIEAEVLRKFWRYLGDRPLLGFNCLQFDVPLLLRRSLYLDVPYPPIQLSRYKHPRIQDLMQILSFEGLLKYQKLKLYCERLNIAEPDPYSGSDIGQLVSDGNWEAVEAHCRYDVRQTLALARRIRLLPPQQRGLYAENK